MQEKTWVFKLKKGSNNYNHPSTNLLHRVVLIVIIWHYTPFQSYCKHLCMWKQSYACLVTIWLTRAGWVPEISGWAQKPLVDYVHNTKATHRVYSQ